MHGRAKHRKFLNEFLIFRTYDDLLSDEPSAWNHSVASNARKQVSIPTRNQEMLQFSAVLMTVCPTQRRILERHVNI